MIDDNAHAVAAEAAPLYDIWRRALPNTATHSLVSAAIEATRDVRRRPSNGKPPRNRKPADQKMYDTLAHGVVCALVHRALTLPGGWTRVPLAHQRAGGAAASRYSSSGLTRSLPGFVRALEDRGWLELVPGYLGRTERVQSIMRSTPALVHEVQHRGCKLTDFTTDASQELIVLKGRKPAGRDGRGRTFAAPWIDYPDTSETKRMRLDMEEVNAWLASAPLDYIERGTGVDAIGDRRMRRVFNNGSFAEGGRLFGGFWLPMSMCAEKAKRRDTPWRAHIRIEGEPIVAVDFVSMFIRLLYAKAGVQPPSGDLFSGIEGLGPEHRVGVKKVMHALLFTDRGLSKLPRGTRVYLPKGIHVRTLLKSINRRHKPVAHLFSTGIGMTLFRLESDIMLEVLKGCRAENVWALPVHDAILVADSRAEDATRIMLAAFKAVTGFDAEVGEPKQPGIDTPELDTMPEEMEDGEEDYFRVADLVKDGHRELAGKLLIDCEADLAARRLPEAPTVEAEYR